MNTAHDYATHKGEYEYMIMHEYSTVIWVRKTNSNDRWTSWGDFDTIVQAREALRRLTKQVEELRVYP